MKYIPFFEPVFEKLAEHNVCLTVNQLVLFEFLRGAASKEEKDIFEKFLRKLTQKGDTDSITTNLTGDLINQAVKIANLYSAKLKNNKIELTDCVLAAEMCQFNKKEEKLYLATANHKDSPKPLFERIGFETIDSGEEFYNIGFYRFDEKKYQALQKEFNKS